eukprot:s1586_g22.t1
MLAFPTGVIDEDAFPRTVAEEDQMVGPSKVFEGIELYEEEEAPSGAIQIVRSGITCSVTVCDFLDSVLAYLRDFDPITDSMLEVVPFDESKPASIPLHADVLTPALEWARSELEGRVLFYSAREEPDQPEVSKAPGTKKAAAKRISNAALAEQVSTLSAQMQLLMKQQTGIANGPTPKTPGPQFRAAGHAPEQNTTGGGFKMPALSQALFSPAKQGLPAAMVGPPPKIRAVVPPSPMPPEEPYHPLDEGLQTDATVAAFSQQSAALTALVAHLINQDSGLELSGVPGAASSSTKGTVKRERMQQELAARKSSFFLQIQQQIYKKLHPSKLLPKSEDELAASQVSLLSYLERYGGYRGQKEAGLSMWIFAHAMDAAASNDFSATKEFLALGVMALEQSVFDAGDWSLAYVLAMVEDPPATMFSDRMSSITAAGRPFSPLVPPQLASTNLAYIKELEVLSTRRSETRAKAKNPGGSPKAQAGEEENQSPRKPKGPRFPKKPKAIADA